MHRSQLRRVRVGRSFCYDDGEACAGTQLSFDGVFGGTIRFTNPNPNSIPNATPNRSCSLDTDPHRGPHYDIACLYQVDIRSVPFDFDGFVVWFTSTFEPPPHMR